jgi:hypothetical protein
MVQAQHAPAAVAVAPEGPQREGPSPAKKLMRLQRSAGNRAVARMVRGTPGGGDGGRDLATEDDTVSRSVLAALRTSGEEPAVQRTPHGVESLIRRSPQPLTITSTSTRVQREPDSDTWDECYKKLTKGAKTGYDQFLALNGEDLTGKKREGGCKEKGTGKNAGKYDSAKAEAMWSKAELAPDVFAAKLEALRQQRDKDDRDSIPTQITKLNNSCDETDGTNRKNKKGGQAGDGTSEWALLQEAANGEPFKSPNGHADKISNYAITITNCIAEIQAKKAKLTDDAVKLDAEAAVLRGTQRAASMKAALLVWNDRVARYPTKWDAHGNSTVAPPGVDPESDGKLKAGWPGKATVPVP